MILNIPIFLGGAWALWDLSLSWPFTIILAILLLFGLFAEDARGFLVCVAGLLALFAFPFVYVAFAFFALGTCWVMLWALARSAAEPTSEPDTEVVARQTAVQLRRLDDVTDFATAIARVQTNTALSVRKRIQQVREYGDRRQRLESCGELTPAVDAELRGQAESSLRDLTRTHGEVGASLDQLLRSYSPQRKVTRWWRS